jgi:16S rRNA (cytosine967-C5)-methyltransferase
VSARPEPGRPRRQARAGGSPTPGTGGRPAPASRPDPRRLALEALGRIDDGAYANLVLPALLADSRLSERDRGFATALVYGTTRMRRACDLLVDRFVLRPLDGATRNALRLGAYQLHHLGTPPHAAVSATVAVAPPRSRGLVNAVLRRVAEAPVTWPDEATRLSYPDWVVARLTADLGAEDAVAALEQMNEPAEVRVRDDGYVQDLASQWVAASVGAEPGERVADVCAAPGGKATALAGTGALVVAGDVDEGRVGLIAANVARVGPGSAVALVVADAALPPWRPASFDRVLVDAPCSGLGVLRRRADARWRVEPGDVDRLAALQQRLLAAAVPLVVAGGTLVYSVCTVTEAETLGVDRWLEEAHPGLVPVGHLGGPWRPHGRGDLLLPHDAGTDGMFVLRLRT